MAISDRESRYGDLPVDLSDVFYDIRRIEVKGPGVYYVVSHDESDCLLCAEHYIVEPQSGIISEEAKRYGKEIPRHPGLLLYSYDEEKGGYRIVEYELAKYAVQTHDDPELVEELHKSAVFYMELHPEYFGAYPAPITTPKGALTRYKTIDNGIFWLETTQCAQLMAVCYPIWESELSDYLKARGLMTDSDKEQGIDETLGYLFFEEKEFCLVIFELVQVREEWIETGMVNRAALMNAIWQFHPDYAASHNINEQHGLNDGLGLLLKSLGHDVELTGSTDNMISIDLDAGVNFLRLK